jgi:hypothetical protein
LLPAQFAIYSEEVRTPALQGPGETTRRSLGKMLKMMPRQIYENKTLATTRKRTRQAMRTRIGTTPAVRLKFEARGSNDDIQL